MAEPDRPPLATILAAAPAFAGLTADELDEIARSICERSVRDGKVLIKQGQWGHELLVVLAGEVEIRRDDVAIAVHGPGSVVGETAVITDSRRNATVTARGDAVVGAIEYRQLHTLMDDIPALHGRLDDIARARGPE